jgi:hypothetical protein
MNYQQLAQIIKIKNSFIMDGKANINSTVAADLAGYHPDPNVKEVSQEFVIPKPNKGERQDDYINRCMDKIGGEYDTPAQGVAVCHATWRNSKK